jgi:hypothetical protein
MKMPEMWARCDACYENAPEMAGHLPECVAWAARNNKWLCEDCWEGLEDIDGDAGSPLLYASDLMLDTDEQFSRMISAATRRRLST